MFRANLPWCNKSYKCVAQSCAEQRADRQIPLESTGKHMGLELDRPWTGLQIRNKSSAVVCGPFGSGLVFAAGSGTSGSGGGDVAQTEEQRRDSKCARLGRLAKALSSGQIYICRSIMINGTVMSTGHWPLWSFLRLAKWGGIEPESRWSTKAARFNDCDNQTLKQMKFASVSVVSKRGEFQRTQSLRASTFQPAFDLTVYKCTNTKSLIIFGFLPNAKQRTKKLNAVKSSHSLLKVIVFETSVGRWLTSHLMNKMCSNQAVFVVPKTMYCGTRVSAWQILLILILFGKADPYHLIMGVQTKITAAIKRSAKNKTQNNRFSQKL